MRSSATKQFAAVTVALIVSAALAQSQNAGAPAVNANDQQGQSTVQTVPANDAGPAAPSNVQRPLRQRRDQSLPWPENRPGRQRCAIQPTAAAQLPAADGKLRLTGCTDRDRGQREMAAAEARWAVAMVQLPAPGPAGNVGRRRVGGGAKGRTEARSRPSVGACSRPECTRLGSAVHAELRRAGLPWRPTSRLEQMERAAGLRAGGGSPAAKGSSSPTATG